MLVFLKDDFMHNDITLTVGKWNLKPRGTSRCGPAVVVVVGKGAGGVTWMRQLYTYCTPGCAS